MRIILLGAPGVGKGTLAKEIVSNLKLTHLSSGDLFRNNKSEYGLIIAKLMAEGKYISDDITNKMMRDVIVNIKNPCGFILDGYPRTINQAQFLETITDIDVVVLLETPEDVLIKRIAGRRSCQQCNIIYNTYFNPSKKGEYCEQCNTLLFRRRDDSEEIAKTRINVYKQTTLPLIDFYKQKKILKILQADNGSSQDLFLNFKKNIYDTLNNK